MRTLKLTTLVLMLLSAAGNVAVLAAKMHPASPNPASMSDLFVALTSVFSAALIALCFNDPSTPPKA